MSFMAQKVVTIFTCDICKTTDEPEDVAGHPRKTTLPKDWVEVFANSNQKRVLSLQLCDTCIGAIKEAVEESKEISAQKLRDSE